MVTKIKEGAWCVCSMTKIFTFFFSCTNSACALGQVFELSF